MPKKVTVSILLSIYNTEFSLVKRAIDSVFNQDYTDFELILIDDGSHIHYEHALSAYLANSMKRSDLFAMIIADNQNP